MRRRMVPIPASLTLLVASGAAWADLPPAPAGVQATHEYGIEFVTVGDAGNRPTLPEELRLEDRWRMGAVAYEYRIARTELTVGQWLEFVRAYDQFYDPPRVGAGFHGHGIAWSFAGQVWHNTVPLDYPTTMNWEYAARYCNWLSNDKAMTAEAFTSGAYDVSTFTYNEDGSANHQEARSPGARFWIPSNDEWTKAVYWDPAKNGGEGGYWYYPGGSDELLIPGPPGVGQTNAGYMAPFFSQALTPVGSYPDVQSPWGLLDASGGVAEWNESIWNPVNRTRFLRRSDAGNPAHDIFDALDWPSSSTVGNSLVGLRLASVVPAPAASLVMTLVLAFQIREKRR